MDTTYILGPSGELYHWGIKGQKWGLRRYQNKDGSLTAAGKKRYAKLEAEMEKLGGKSAGDAGASKAKSVSDMTDDEINAKINRMNLEKRYNEAMASNEQKSDTASPKSNKSNTAANTKKNISDMTDDEINARIERIKLENRLKELMTEPVKTVETKKETSAGKRIVGEILTNSVKNIGQQAATYAMGAGVNYLAKNVLGIKNATEKRKRDDGTEEIIDIFQDIVNPRKGQKDK